MPELYESEPFHTTWAHTKIKEGMMYRRFEVWDTGTDEFQGSTWDRDEALRWARYKPDYMVFDAELGEWIIDVWKEA